MNGYSIPDSDIRAALEMKLPWQSDDGGDDGDDDEAEDSRHKYDDRQEDYITRTEYTHNIVSFFSTVYIRLVQSKDTRVICGPFNFLSDRSCITSLDN